LYFWHFDYEPSPSVLALSGHPIAWKADDPFSQISLMAKTLGPYRKDENNPLLGQ
jgi:hypothetical protein